MTIKIRQPTAFRALAWMSGLVSLTACQLPTYAPGPGMAAANINMGLAQCRLAARGMSKSFGFGAAGSPKFVAAAAVSAIAVGAIANAIDQRNIADDCMQAQGWRVVDTSRGFTPAAAPMVQPIEMADAQLSRTSVVTKQLSVAHTATLSASLAPRRPFLVKGTAVTEETAALLRLEVPRGVVLMDVMPGGAAAAAGLLPGDVLLTLNDLPLNGMDNLVAVLDRVPAGSRVVAGVWRAGAETPVQLRF